MRGRNRIGYKGQGSHRLRRPTASSTTQCRQRKARIGTGWTLGNALSPRAIFSSAHAWDSPVQLSSHHLARQFARHGWRVLFLANPTSWLHALLRSGDDETRRKLAEWRAGGATAEFGVRHYSPLTMLPPAGAWPLNGSVAISRWLHFTVPNLLRWIARHGFGRPDLVVLDTPIQAFLFDAVHAGRRVYRLTDFNPGFASASGALQRAERRLAATADIVICTAEELLAYASGLGAVHSACVPNGVDVQQFTSPRLPPPEYAEIPSPRAIYVGKLESWFDFAGLDHAAATLPEVSFVLIGPKSDQARSTLTRRNIFRLGARPHSEIAAYLQHAQVGLIPFSRAAAPALVDAIHPLKLYEYLAAGLPVVAADWKEIRRIGAPVRLYESPEHLVDQLRASLLDRDRPARIAFAQQADWTERYARFVALALDQPPRVPA